MPLGSSRAFSVGVQMSEYIALGDWRLFFQARDDIPKVTAQQVADVSKKYFVRDNRTTGIFLPEDNPQRAEIPAAPKVAPGPGSTSAVWELLEPKRAVPLTEITGFTVASVSQARPPQPVRVSESAVPVSQSVC